MHDLRLADVIYVDFNPGFRKNIADGIRLYGHKAIEKDLIENARLSPSFVKGLIRSIIRKEGW